MKSLPPRLYHLTLYLLPLLTTVLALFLVLNAWNLQSELLLGTHHQELPSTSAPQLQPPPKYTTCGTSPITARSRNCTFDILSFAWQLPPCYDAPLMTSFLSYPTPLKTPHNPNHWKFYTHPGNSSATVSLEIALLGERTLYVNWEYHVTHCIFMWMQMHRAYRVGGWIDGHLDGWSHTIHCKGAVLERGVDGGEVNVVAEVKYPECREVGGREWKGSGEGEEWRVGMGMEEGGDKGHETRGLVRL